MKKVMLVDDELDILYGLQMMLDWESLGFQVSAMCADGYEALELCEQAVPDIIVTDIRMSGMDGLALGQQIAHRYPKTRLIILTSYSEYDYLQKAIDLRVSAYLLKPVDEEKLKEALLKAASEIDAQISSDRRLDALVSYQVRSSAAVLFSAFAKLLSGEASLWEAEREAVMDSIREGKTRLLIVREDVPPQFLPAGESVAEDYFYKTITIAVRNRSELYYSEYRDGQAIFVFATEDVGAFLEKVRSTCTARMQNTYSAIVTAPFLVPEEISALRVSARKQLKYEMLFGKSGSDYVLNGETVAATMPEKPMEQLRLELETALLSRDPNQVDEVLDSFLLELQSRRGQLSEYEANAAVSRMENLLLELLNYRCHISTDNLEELRFSLLLTRHMPSLEQIVRFISEQVAEALESTSDTVYHNTPEVLRPVLQYIQEHYTEALTLEGVAKMFHLNASYLSRIFRKSTGLNYMSYVTNLRIEKAKRLLLDTDLVISEIALCCGFLNEPTFYTTFKRSTGRSPGEFRKRSRHN